MSRYTPGEGHGRHRVLHTAREVTAAHVGHLVSAATTDHPNRGYLRELREDGDSIRLDLQVRDGRVLPVWVEQDTAVLIHRTRQQDRREDES